MKNYVQKWSVLVVMLGTLFTSCQTFSDEEVQATASQSTENGTAKNNKANVARVATYSLSNWMGALDENQKLTAFTIPGTHDSGARYEPVSGTATCQTLTIDEQLSAGVRYLDIRCRHLNNAFVIHHGSVYQKINFTDVLNSCSSFLLKNPSETIIMSVKEEHTASGNNRSYEATFDSYVQQNPSLWYLEDTIPTLKNSKGKIVLLKRFSATKTKGIEATNWSDNTVFEINNAQSIKVQDQYKVPDNNAKWNLISTLANEAKVGSNAKLYLNFCSGYKSGIFGIPSISTVSNAINPKVTSYFTTNTKGRFGVIIMDFAESGRNNLIIKTNF
jgi:1-phosphatidylinositol phosphodiesterase